MNEKPHYSNEFSISGNRSVELEISFFQMMSRLQFDVYNIHKQKTGTASDKTTETTETAKPAEEKEVTVIPTNMEEVREMKEVTDVDELDIPVNQLPQALRNKSQKHILVIEKQALNIVCKEIQKIPYFKFLLASKDRNKAYIFAVFTISVEIRSEYILHAIKPYSKYMDNVEFIWKRGPLAANINCNLWADRCENANRLTAHQILSLDDDEAQKTLSLKDYYRYMKLKKKNN